MKLIIDIPEELYETYKGRPPMLGDAGIDTIAQSIANGTPLPKTGWIPVSERLPEDNGYYLTTTMFGEVYCDYWTECSFDRQETVIAWKPLSEPYKAESEEKK